MPLTREQRIANLAKAREAKRAKFEKEYEEANKPVTVTLPDVIVMDEGDVTPEKTPLQVITVTASHENMEEITLQSLDARPLEVCIADVCWRGKEIDITQRQHQHFVAKGNPDFTYKELVSEVVRILKEGGYIFQAKGTGI